MACPSCLNLMMKFVYIMPYRQQDTLGGYICLPSVYISPESHILFNVCKASFRLYASVHSKLCSIITGNPFYCFLTFFFHLFRNIQYFLPVLHWGFTVVSLNAVCFERALAASAASIYGNSSPVSTGRLFSLFILHGQHLSVFTVITVRSASQRNTSRRISCQAN